MEINSGNAERNATGIEFIPDDNGGFGVKLRKTRR
jgi:hypothetical protein